jgi:hypothetical protein
VGTLVGGAPLLAAGPPGWAIYALLAIVSLPFAAVVVYRASREADQIFAKTEPSSVQQCEKDKPKPVPLPQSKTRSCKTEHPDTVLCSSLPDWYEYSSEDEAFKALKERAKDSGKKGELRKEKTRPADRGPCPGQGTHTGVRRGGEYVASIVCCPCCTDTPAGPVLSTKCGIV